MTSESTVGTHGKTGAAGAHGASANDCQLFKTLMDALESGHRAVLATTLNQASEGNVLAKKLFTNSEPNESEALSDDALELSAFIEGGLQRGEFTFEQAEDGTATLVEPYFPEAQLVILGGGHIAVPLAEFGAKAGFKVTVVDDRPFFANNFRFPAADKVICDSFDNSFDSLKLNKATFVVIVTRGHRYDKVCLENVLKYETAYVGMIGSRRRVTGLKDLLLSEGQAPDKLASVCTPIGLEIGAVTPEEIAISILAQVIQYKRKGDKANRKANNWPELDLTVLRELAKPDQETRALVTVVETKGSVPRREGAKMVVWMDGRTIGSIGGGCSEGEAIQTARDVIRDGRFRYLDIDMTGQVAEDEGMVCGGTMKVLITPV
ncbi:XdhC/CoxI family protein [Acidaminobacter hydrogenoformans]|uniref:Xanthine dehydrogenase accessory factor n=1 Tax=Acidaminobacter hydrogenoformans DSM 2784 TaxID=1120920 RepID=A0A1G5S0R0_9FIRM|nr:XdhC/CoxI family protein [Acidaminobacter hydrogenoformans]SCZ80015.1 xanthine dehydrogenase accessory factor [Acidaminobacter hydrogenoformans DSM 2784]